MPRPDPMAPLDRQSIRRQFPRAPSTNLGPEPADRDFGTAIRYPWLTILMPEYRHGRREHRSGIVITDARTRSKLHWRRTPFHKQLVEDGTPLRHYRRSGGGAARDGVVNPDVDWIIALTGLPESSPTRLTTKRYEGLRRGRGNRGAPMRFTPAPGAIRDDNGSGKAPALSRSRRKAPGPGDYWLPPGDRLHARHFPWPKRPGRQ